MKSKILVNLIFTILVMSSFAFAQKKTCDIQKVYGFYTESVSGNIAVNRDGNPLRSPVSIWYTFYVETRIDNLVKFDSVKIGAVKYPISSSSIQTKFPLDVGKLKNMFKSYLINPINGNKILKLDVFYSKPIHDTATTLEPIVLLEGKYKKRKIVYVVNSILKLQAPLYP